MRHNRIVFLLGYLLLVSLAACGESKPVRLYVLTAVAEKPETASGPGIPIVVGPVTLPKYLDRPQVVSRIASNSLDQSEFDQWGGDLNDNITRVLATNLAVMLNTNRVFMFPSKDPTPPEYQITVDVTKFEQDVDGGVVLNAFWSIVNPADDKVLVRVRSSYNGGSVASVSGGAANRQAYDALVAAMSRDLEALSRDIAAAVAKIRRS